MAHPNIDQRRESVISRMRNGKLTNQEIKELVEEFNCDASAIRADIIALNNQHIKVTRYISKAKKERIIARDGYRCYLCGKLLTKEEIIIEHKIPASHGGTADEDNLAVACQPCNIKKRYADEKKYGSF